MNENNKKSLDDQSVERLEDKESQETTVGKSSEQLSFDMDNDSGDSGTGQAQSQESQGESQAGPNDASQETDDPAKKKRSRRNNSTDDKPLIVDGSKFSEQKKVAQMSKFQHIRTGFFAQTKEAALTINGKVVSVNTAAVRLFPDVDYMEILINPEDLEVAFEPTDSLNLKGYKWSREKDGKRYPTQRTGLPFALCVGQLMGWEGNQRYKMLGARVPADTGKDVLLFDLKTVQAFDKPNSDEKGNGRSTILTGWDGTFGPAYDEGGGSLKIDKFDKFTVFSLKEGWVEKEVSADGEIGEEDVDGGVDTGTNETTAEDTV